MTKDPLTAQKNETYDLGEFTVERYTLSLGGTVADEAGNPIAGVKAHVRSERPNFPGITTITDEHGVFTIKFLPKDTFELGIWDDDERYESVNLDVEAGFDYGVTLKKK